MKYEQPFPGGGDSTQNSGRDMHASNPDSGMQPTPEPAHLAHCCECNQREIDSAHIRQQRANVDDEYRQIISSAAEIAQHTLGECTDAAKDLLEAVFKAKLKRISKDNWSLK